MAISNSPSHMPSRIVAGVPLLSVLLVSAVGEAKPTIAVLSFGGSDGAAARAGIVTQLERTHTVLEGERVLAACSELGIEMKRGPNLAKAAAHIGAVAVIGGSAADGRLAVAVYSGETGEPLVASAVQWSPGGSLGAALGVIRKGLRKAPAQVSGSEPTFSPDPPADGSSGQNDGLTFEPEPVDTEALPDEGAAFDPGGTLSSEPENPLEKKPADVAVEKGFSWGSAPRVAGSLGVGMWSRTFSLNDAVPDRPHPQYKSGAAMALQIELRLWPLAFFLDGIPSDFWVRLRYQTALGLSSAVKDGAVGLSTSLSEVLIDGGYDFQIGPQTTSPHFDLGIGYGTLGFSIDWGAASPTLPAASYEFLLLGVGFRHPFSDYVGYHLRFDYRVVFGAGEIEKNDPDRWYGPATAGGISGTAGLTGIFKGFTARADYSYARYFYSFKEGAKRQSSAQRAAGGALDQLHSIIVGLGYMW